MIYIRTERHFLILQIFDTMDNPMKYYLRFCIRY